MSQPNLRNEIVPLRSSLALKAAQLTLANSVRQDEMGSVVSSTPREGGLSFQGFASF